MMTAQVTLAVAARRTGLAAGASAMAGAARLVGVEVGAGGRVDLAAFCGGVAVVDVTGDFEVVASGRL